jgi:hypothetical protein
MRKISPIAAIATAVWWMRSSGRKTVPSPRYAARVEHSIGVIKRVFGFAKVHRGLTKNTHRLLVTCALANLFMARRYLLRCKSRNLSDVATIGCAAADRKPITTPTPNTVIGYRNINGGHPFADPLFRPSLAQTGEPRPEARLPRDAKQQRARDRNVGNRVRMTQTLDGEPNAMVARDAHH